MRRAVCMIRKDPHYRREAFERGLERAGFVLQGDGIEPDEGDALLVWNLSGHAGMLAEQWHGRGALVFVAENGYIGTDANGVQRYALARNAHNGAGSWHVGGGERWDALGIELKPWHTDGSTIVIRGQRGIGSREMASPPQWHEKASRDLRRLWPDRMQIIQQHPGKPANDPQVAADILEALRNAWALCIWSSAAGVRALIEGVPVFYDAPHWICEGAAVHRIGNLDHPKRDDDARLRAMQRMAWAQWTIDEISSGEPFVLLKELHEWTLPVTQ